MKQITKKINKVVGVEYTGKEIADGFDEWFMEGVGEFDALDDTLEIMLGAKKLDLSKIKFRLIKTEI